MSSVSRDFQTRCEARRLWSDASVLASNGVLSAKYDAIPECEATVTKRPLADKRVVRIATYASFKSAAVEIEWDYCLAFKFKRPSQMN
jgi:hypothetical protein